MLTVFGSINLDVSVRVPRLGGPGETLLGGEVRLSAGGKGANQAHAARLFGREVRMIGAVGGDAFAEPALRGLRQASVDLSGVRQVEGATGMATISVLDNGENAIVVAPGANNALRSEWVSDEVLRSTGVLLLQLEVPPEESMQLAERARRLGCQVMLNAAPARDLALIRPACIDWLIVNRTELDQICDDIPLYGIDPADMAAMLANEWAVNIVVTLGAEGALLVTREGQRNACPAVRGHVVDTTGAGDTFTGVFAAAIATRLTPGDALRLGVTAAGLACRRPGAQECQPSFDDILHELSTLGPQ